MRAKWRLWRCEQCRRDRQIDWPTDLLQRFCRFSGWLEHSSAFWISKRVYKYDQHTPATHRAIYIYWLLTTNSQRWATIFRFTPYTGTLNSQAHHQPWQRLRLLPSDSWRPVIERARCAQHTAVECGEGARAMTVGWMQGGATYILCSVYEFASFVSPHASQIFHILYHVMPSILPYLFTKLTPEILQVVLDCTRRTTMPLPPQFYT